MRIQTNSAVEGTLALALALALAEVRNPPLYRLVRARTRSFLFPPSLFVFSVRRISIASERQWHECLLQYSAFINSCVIYPTSKSRKIDIRLSSSSHLAAIGSSLPKFAFKFKKENTIRQDNYQITSITFRRIYFVRREGVFHFSIPMLSEWQATD